MRLLSDYKGAEAIELWADLMEPLGAIFTDKEVAKAFQSKQPVIKRAQAMLKGHAKDVYDLLERINGEALDGITVVAGLVSLLNELSSNKELAVFFNLPGQKIQDESSGSVTENTEGGEK